VVAFEWPTGGGGADEIETEKNEPKIEPRGPVDVGAGDAGAEPGFEKGSHGTDSGESDEEEHGEVEGAEGVDSAPNRGAGAAGGDHLFTGFVERHKRIIEGTSERTRGVSVPKLCPSYPWGVTEGVVGRKREVEDLGVKGCLYFLILVVSLGWAGEKESSVVRSFLEEKVGVGQEWSLVDDQGKQISSARYDWVGPFSEGLAPAKEKKQWGYVDSQGKWTIQPYFSDARPFRGGLAAVQVGGEFGFADKTNYGQNTEGVRKRIYPADRSVATALGGKWGLIDVRGNYVVEPKYAEIREGREGLIPVREGVRWGFVDSHGEIKIKVEYGSVELFSGEWAKVTEISGRAGFVNREGQFSRTGPLEQRSLEVNTAAGSTAAQ